MIINMFMLKARTLDRLDSMQSTYLYELNEEIDVSDFLTKNKALDARLSQAGYIDLDEQLRVKKVRLGVGILVLLTSVFLSLSYFGKPIPVVVTGVLSLYCFFVAWVIWLKLKTSDVVRSAYFDLPLILEELILLVESGLGLFPALERVCAFDKSDFIGGDPGVCRKVFKKAYSLAVCGMPVGQAFETVSRATDCVPLKQVLIHLDVSSGVGGELLTSLRALSEQVHKEWKLSVETRVKRLENLVVFPVFMAVMGLLLLTAAVPIVPVLDFMGSLNQGNAKSDTGLGALQ